MKNQKKQISIPVLAVVLFIFALADFSIASAFLKVQDDIITDRTGKPVFLRGFNVEFKDFRTVLDERDIRRIAESGATCIRLALNYRDFETAPFRYHTENFLLLDRILQWSKKSGIYVILDMHLAPGIQNLHDFVVHRGEKAEFWSSRDFQERFYALWAFIAKRYKDRTTVAGYDLLNEGTPADSTQYRIIMNRTARRIREHDKNHILIVEEAVLRNGGKELTLIDDKNAIYSMHFFHPPQFSFYVTTNERPLTTYPGDMITSGSVISETRSEAITGDNSWSTMSVSGTPPDDAEIVRVKVSSEGNRGTVWFDDLQLTINDVPVDLPAPLVPNGSFEIDYPGINWNSSGSCISTTNTVARSGKHSLVFSECQSLASAESSPLTATSGIFRATTWYKSEGATGDTRLVLSWHKKRILQHIDKDRLLEKMRYALDFKNRHKVPLYVGEFTAHLNPSPESVRRYLTDLLDIFTAEGLHWSFWEYYSIYNGVGIFSGNSPHLVNTAAWQVLNEYLRRKQ